MYAYRVVDIIFQALSWSNLRAIARRTRMVWPITRRLLAQRRGQVALMSLAVALGFAAFLSFQVIYSTQSSSFSGKVNPIKLPTPLVVRHQLNMPAPAVEEIRKLVSEMTPAWEVTAWINGKPIQALAFADGDTFWQEQITQVDGTLALGAAGVALPASLAQALHVGVGDQLNVFHASVLGPEVNARLTVQATFTSDKALFDHAITSMSAPFLSAYSLEAPNLLFIDVTSSSLARVQGQISSMLYEYGPYPWQSRPSNSIPRAKLIDGNSKFTLLWQQGSSSFLSSIVTSIIRTSYSSGKVIVKLIYVFSALCVFNILLISLLGRRRDVGILKTIGFDDLSIFASFLIEGATIAGLGVILGVLITLLALQIVSHYSGVHLIVAWQHYVSAGMVSFVVYTVSAAVPADMARFTPVMDLLHERKLVTALTEDPYAEVMAEVRKHHPMNVKKVYKP